VFCALGSMTGRFADHTRVVDMSSRSDASHDDRQYAEGIPCAQIKTKTMED
jgi:hypothetical protein